MIVSLVPYDASVENALLTLVSVEVATASVVPYSVAWPPVSRKPRPACA